LRMRRTPSTTWRVRRVLPAARFGDDFGNRAPPFDGVAVAGRDRR
jgi:hypothetical protein